MPLKYSCSKKFMVISVFKNLVFKTSRESIEIHHWSIPHCGKPQQFNIQNSTLRSAPPCANNIRVIRVITSLRSVVLRRISCSKKDRVTSVFKNLVFKTSCESIEIHHWSIPHCGQPQQFNIQHSKVKIALRASVC